MNRWLADPDLLIRNRIPKDLPPLRPAASQEDALGVVRGDNGEPLVPITGVEVKRCYAEIDFAGMPPRAMLRAGLLDRIQRAQTALPEGFTIVVLDGWRTRDFQGELLNYYRELSGGDMGLFVSDPSWSQRMLPHVSGGAVDLTLAVDGVPVAMGSDFDVFDESSFLLAFEDVPDDGDPARLLAKDLRRLLGKVLVDVGCAPYPLEWWHWSYGDQLWAAFAGESVTLYSEINN